MIKEVQEQCYHNHVETRQTNTGFEYYCFSCEKIIATTTIGKPRFMEGLRESDDNIGKCYYCDNLIFRDDDWCLGCGSKQIAHRKCNSIFMNKAS